MPYNYQGVARILVQSGLLSAEDAAQATESAKGAKTGLLRYVEENRLVELDRLHDVLSREFSVPTLDLAAFNLTYTTDAIKMVDEELVRAEKVLPIFKRGTKLYVAVSDPTNIEVIDRIQFKTRQKVLCVLVSAKVLDGIIETALGGGFDSLDDGDDSDFDNLDLEAASDTPAESEDEDVTGDETPIVKFVNKVLLDAINRGASDIHLEPYEKFYRVRYRIDGMLREVAKPPLSMATRITARLKVISNLDISEKRIPQDGRIKLKLSKTKSIDFRVNTCPTLFGEKIVMRILDSSSAMLGIEALGYEPQQEAAYLKALANPYGMILVTGPTGSGKTVSLYTGLNILNTVEVNISTAEDPAEINLPGVNQVNMNPKAGLNFNSTLRAFLRQDPDVIMVGEIRDL
ncbi:MAG: Flp pilus assembly complex ATPase component TadA, partial [Proteobacteria bacterium]|nr:Flp pilus assembly complex ATPase component TadA [Pseudomonadota bacterium]